MSDKAPERIARLAADFHETYERIAAGEGWETQEDCRVAFDDLPEANKATMLAVCAEIHKRHIAELEAKLAERDASFQLRWDADMRAIKRWRAEKPDERELAMPDHVDFVVWREERLCKAEALLDEGVAEAEEVLRWHSEHDMERLRYWCTRAKGVK